MRHTIYRLGWVVAVGMALLAAASLAGALYAGPLDPPGPLGPTMKTLEDVDTSWDRTLSSTGGCASERWQCVMGDTAVLDRETGLVWEKVPAPDTATATWDSARRICMVASTGGRMGWRLPTVEEFRSLLTPSGLPSGHPFTVGGLSFWTSTTASDATTNAYRVNPANPTANLTGVKGGMSPSFNRYWCVRGGTDHDGY